MGKRKDNVLTLCEELTKAPDDLIYLIKVRVSRKQRLTC